MPKPIFVLFFPVFILFFSCSQNENRAAGSQKTPPAFCDSAAVVSGNGKIITVKGRWLRQDISDHQDRVFLDDGHYLLIGFCSYSDTMSRLLMNAAEKNCLGKKIRITGRFYREYPDSCPVYSRYADPKAIGYMDFVNSIEADTTNSF